METAVMNTNALVVMSQPQMLEKLQHSEVRLTLIHYLNLQTFCNVNNDNNNNSYST